MRIAVLCFLVLGLTIRGTGRERSVRTDCAAQSRDDECQKCHHEDRNGKCVLDDDCTVHHGDSYEPEPGEECWVIEECLCEEGQYPSANSCSPCQDVGRQTVCRHH
jgi:hypothetical protein